MTKLLEEAIKKVSAMPDKEQDEIAALILDEVTWDTAIEGSKDKLSLLAERAVKYHKNGETTDLHFDK